MRRLILIFALLAVGAAQEQKPASPAPAEPSLAGAIDFGYRWRSDVSGNFNTYRSIVNLGAGPRLFGLDAKVQNPSRRLFDRLLVRANGWGGDPYNTGRVEAERSRVYRFSFDYRNIAYFNFLPSFANPQAERGGLVDQHSFDVERRLADFNLEMRPGSAVVPYMEYTRDSGRGTGITTFVADGNEYPVLNRVRDHTNHWRYGTRFEYTRWHMTLENGVTDFKDDQSVFWSGENRGNRTTLLAGERLLLNNLAQTYGVFGDSIYFKGLFSASPVSWADFHAQFLYSVPRSDASYLQSNTGRFVVLSSLLFYNSQQASLAAAAKLPHTSANAGFELRPFSRLRIVESWLTDRLHNAASGQLTDQILSGATPVAAVNPFTDRLVLNYNQQQVDAFLDLTSKLTLRGGHRYVWGDSGTRTGRVAPVQGLVPSEIRQQVGLAGLHFRAGSNLTLNFDYEGAASERAYFRTSLRDYHKGRARVRYLPLASLTVSASSSWLANDNPTRGITYDFLSRENSLTLHWRPAGGKRLSVLADYSHLALRGDLFYIAPDSGARERSFYRDFAHTATALVSLALPGQGSVKPALTLGGSLFDSSGSRPARYYQPLARFLLPFGKHVEWNAEWRYFGFGQEFYLYEAFRSHQFATGLRLLR